MKTGSRRQITIAIDGPDKVGKATQSKLLAGHLGADLAEIPFKDGATHTQIYHMLRVGTAAKHKEAFQAFHVANRLVWQTQIMPTLGPVVVLDRWNSSTWVYGAASGLSVDCISSMMVGLIEPDFTVILDGEAMAPGEDVYELDSVFRKRVREGYITHAAEKGYPVIRADSSRADVHSCILRALEFRFPLPLPRSPSP